MRKSFAAALLLAASFGTASYGAQPGNLEFYWIDTEGGSAALVVSPTGDSMLLDTGHIYGDSRFNKNNIDAKRIFDATQAAGLKRINSVVISHWHTDHVGGVPELAKLIPINHFYDHGDGVSDEGDDRAGYDGYIAAAGNKRTVVKAGDTIPFAGADVIAVSSEDSVLQKPVKGAGAPNPLCENAVRMPKAGAEDQRMLGVLLTFGGFRYLGMGDQGWYREMELTCPVNKLGKVNLWVADRHGSLEGAGAPAFLGAISPQVVIISNGPRKGLGRAGNPPKPIEEPGKTYAPYEKNSYLRLAQLPGIEGIWQSHLSLADSDPTHNTKPDMIANLDEPPTDKGYWIHGTVTPDGRFTITNARNGYSVTYAARNAP